jgi:uncharacterized membrane protein
MKLLKKEWLQLVILVLPFCAAALLWNRLPEKMPIHWNARWQVNGYAEKTFAALFAPCLNIGLALLIGLVPFIDPKITGYDEETRKSVCRTARIIRLAITTFLSAMGLGILLVAVKAPINMSTVMQVGVALLFIALGNVLGKLRPNYFFGIRTPWTLESREVWMRTHRLAAQLMVAGGFCLLVLEFLVPAQFYFYCVFIPVFTLMWIIPIAYSYLFYRTAKRA